ncbi:MAG: efflux RND transporter periplasmic adaptor subunit, partial [Planctomycetota bacterium]
MPMYPDESPSKDVTLSYTRSGMIAAVLVRDGDQVRAGQVLVRLDDLAEQVALAKLKAESEDVTQVLAAEAQLAQSRVDLEKTEWAFERGAATNLEVEHAKLQVRITELSLQLARFKQDQAGLEYERIRLELDRMQLASSIDGVIELVAVEVGESVDARADVIRVVAIDPLWIDVPTPLSQALDLQLGQVGEVLFIDEDDDDQTPARRLRGQIVHIASVADAASDTLVVRLEAPNPDAIPAGQRVWVSFLDEVAPLPEP